mmetsp:Transcript_1988/g.4829  ORF Transcript_1988/g.4829 Transcript_1988/m.4829 type:complete len:151 (+) Transcript_1988:78-530(+)
MDSELGRALVATGTSNQWSMLDGVTTKVNKRLPKDQQVTPKQLDTFLKQVGDEELRQNGIWRTSFGAKYMPIIVVNTGLGRILRLCNGAQPPCSCGALNNREDKFLSSQAYNAGRHALVASPHKASCGLWTPPQTSHLHSWRRGFTDANA